MCLIQVAYRSLGILLAVTPPKKMSPCSQQLLIVSISPGPLEPRPSFYNEMLNDSVFYGPVAENSREQRPCPQHTLILILEGIQSLQGAELGRQGCSIPSWF